MEVKRMEEKRYSLRTVGKIIGVTAMAAKNRANKLGIDTSIGVTAKDVKAIQEYKCNPKHVKKCSLEDLMRELG